MCDNYHLEPESHGTCQGAVPVEALGFSGLGYLPKHLIMNHVVHILQSHVMEVDWATLDTVNLCILENFLIF